MCAQRLRRRIGSRGPITARRFRGLAASARRPGIEALEVRALLTANLYLDFGDNFPAGGLVMSALQLRSDFGAGTPGLQGPDVRRADNAMTPGVNEAIVDGTMLVFNPMAPSVTFDYNGDALVDNTDYTDLRAATLALVRRYYAPLDVNVIIAPPVDNTSSATYIAGVRAQLQTGLNQNGEFDGWVFASDIRRQADNRSVGVLTGNNGVSNGSDIGGNNAEDNVAVAYVDQIFGGAAANSTDTRLAYTMAHEGAHDFGIAHRNNGTSGTALDADMAQLTRSELVTESAGAINRTNFVFSTRYPLIRGDGNNNPPPPANSFNANDVANQFLRLANNNNLGLRTGAPDYITGTGAHDIITVTNLNAAQATVTVQAFRDAAYASAITVPGTAVTTFSYTVSKANGLLVEAGFGNDRIILDANLGVNVSVFGMGGVDEMIVMGGGAASGSYTPGNAVAVKLDDNQAFSGTIVAGSTTIAFDEFDTAGSITVRDIANFTFRTPNSNDLLMLNSPQAGRNRIAGSSGGTAFVPLVFFNNASMTLDLATNDGATGADTLVITSALAAAGLQNLTVNAGTGNDTLNLMSPNLALPVPGGAFSYNAGSSTTPSGDQIVAQGNVDWTLSNTSLISSGGGLVALSSVESAHLTGGASGNFFSVSGWTGLGSLSGQGGSDTVVAAKDTHFALSDTALATFDGMNLGLSSIEVAVFMGGAGPNMFDVGGWTGSGAIAAMGGNDTLTATKDRDFTLSSTALLASDGMTLAISGFEIADLTGGASNNQFTVGSWLGISVALDGLGGNDTYTLAAGDLDSVAAFVSILDTAGSADAVVLNDAGNAKLVDYTVATSGVSTQFTAGGPRAFPGLSLAPGTIESLTLNATTGANNFYVTPDAVTEFFINGNNPTFAGPGVDYLEVDFTGTSGRKLTYSGPPLGNGTWEFLGSGNPVTGARKTITFTSIEKIKYFEILAVGADAGFSSRPTVKVYDAETGDLSLELEAYESHFRGGVRVAVGDVNGDGIPEIITAPGPLRAADVKVFDVLSGAKKHQFVGAYPGVNSGLHVAVGDVTGDGRADIVTGWQTGSSHVYIFPNTGSAAAPFANYNGIARPGNPVTPSLNAFAGIFTLSFGIGGIAIGNVQGHAGGVGDIVVAAQGALVPAVRVFDYFSNGTSSVPVRQITPFDLLSTTGPLTVAVGNVDSASGRADIVIGGSTRGRGEVVVWHNDSNSLTRFTPYTGLGSSAPVRVAIKQTGLAGGEIFTGQGPLGKSNELRRFSGNGALIDHILETDPEFDGGFWLG